MEKIGRFRVDDDERVVEIRVPGRGGSGSGSGGTIDPGELGIVGDRIQRVDGSIDPAQVVVVLAEVVAATAVRIAAEKFVQALQSTTEPRIEIVDSDLVKWGLDVEG